MKNLEFKGTKGKWIISPTDNNFITTNDDKFAISKAFCSPFITEDERKANAKLIASAPDLLEVLLSIENDDNSIPKSIWDMRNKAIEKALNK